MDGQREEKEESECDGRPKNTLYFQRPLPSCFSLCAITSSAVLERERLKAKSKLPVGLFVQITK